MKRFKAQLGYVSMMMLIFGFLVMAGCGGLGSSDEAALIDAQQNSVLPGECNVDGLQILEVSPFNNQEGVPVNAVISVLFNRPIDPTRIVVTDSENPESLAFTLRDNNRVRTKGTVDVDLFNVWAFFTPDANLNGDSWYTVTVTDYVKDADGNSLSCSYKWEFKTQ